ncbi:MAG: efflux RND transporter periplasmic adaptor subunit [Legionella sp.]|nr:efflux RND transporter periplasmic adaptor subunit [Legionella sp.]
MNTVINYPRKLFKYGLVTVSLFALINCDGSKTASPPKPPVPVVKVATTNIPVTREYIGITQSIASVDIRARVKGFLIKMNFEEGKAVKKDQLLFVIDPKPFEAKLSLAQGKLSQSIAAKEYQQIEYLRLKVLVAKGDISKSNFDKVSAQFSEAVAQVEVASAEVEQAKINLGYTSMYSPIDGIISHKYVDVGNLVGGAESTVLANVVKLDPMYVQFSPSVNDFGEFLKYRANMPFKVKATLPQDGSEIFTGQIDLVNNQAQVPTSTILMRALIQNPANLLLPGIYVNLTLTLTDKNPAILVPIKSVMETQGRRTVYVVDAKNSVQSRLINASGQYQQNYIVTSGLKDGEMVITNGLQKIRPGQEVTPQITNK